ncbi:Cyclin-A1, partial [Podochytrium sp. JEL0797]
MEQRDEGMALLVMQEEPDREMHWGMLRRVKGAPLSSYEFANFRRHTQLLKEMQAKEDAFRPRPTLLKNHPEFTQQSKMVLCSWFAEVCHEKRYARQTYHLAVAMLNMYLMKEKGVRELNAQVLGAAILFRAIKME